MVLVSILLLGDIMKRNQTFRRICMLTLICIITAKPYQRNTSEPLADIKSDNALFDVERQKIISELKSKILSRLKLDYLPSNHQTFSWDSVPEEMREVFNEELEVDNGDNDGEDVKLETTVATVVRSNLCNFNRSKSIIYRECFNVTIPNLSIDDITSAKLIASLKRNTDIDFRNSFKFNLTINHYEMVYDLSIGSKESGDIEVNIPNSFKEMLSKDPDVHNSVNGTSLFLYFDRQINFPRISEIIEDTKMVLEIQYKSPILKRSKRSTNICRPNQYFCCRQSIKVNIQELELMRYIAAPRTFTINYCKGDCNNNIRYSSNHAKAINLLRGQDIIEPREMRSCCVPYSFARQKIIYVNAENTVSAETFNDLSAASCGCL